MLRSDLAIGVVCLVVGSGEGEGMPQCKADRWRPKMSRGVKCQSTSRCGGLSTVGMLS